MKNLAAKSILLVALASSSTLAPAAFAQDAASQLGSVQATSTLVQEDNTKARSSLSDYDLGKKDLALEGYDPVAYFPEFGGKATKGDKKITAKHRGVLYRFSSEANKAAFLKDPNRFEPMYGGWCAWAMTDGKGDKTGANPKSFTIEDGRLYVFYDGFFGDTRKTWNKKGKAPKLKANADKNWTRMSGEAARAGDSKKKK
ncbi:MAG: YHS domain-containing (seleno)protein [Planctomycetota bacterium]